LRSVARDTPARAGSSSLSSATTAFSSRSTSKGEIEPEDEPRDPRRDTRGMASPRRSGVGGELGRLTIEPTDLNESLGLGGLDEPTALLKLAGRAGGPVALKQDGKRTRPPAAVAEAAAADTACPPFCGGGESSTGGVPSTGGCTCFWPDMAREGSE